VKGELLYLKVTRVLLSAFGLLLVVASCSGKSPGEACTWQGSGFTAKHDCRMGGFCLQSVSCPNGKQVNYGSCVSGKCSPDRPCPPGHICVRYSDNASYCIPAPVCSDETPKSSP
jgi:hypothetical protein